MPVVNPQLVRGFWRDHSYRTPYGMIIPRKTFQPTFNGGDSLRYPTVWLHNSDPHAVEAFAAERKLDGLVALTGAQREAAAIAETNFVARQQAWLSVPDNRRRLAAVYGAKELTPDHIRWAT
jgi:hypothetical protein